jgi:hypothetical protein
MKPSGKRKRPALRGYGAFGEDPFQNENDHNDVPHPELPNNIGIFDNILSQQECQELIAIHNSNRHAGYIHHLTVSRFADFVGGSNMELLLGLVLPLIRARYIIWQCVEEHFNCLLELYPEFTALVAWHAGSFLQSHFDANRDYLQDRHFSAVLYLNDSWDEAGQIGSNKSMKGMSGKTPLDHNVFEGGDLVLEFPSSVASSDDHSNILKQEYHVRPKAGRLVCFPSTADYPHRVDPITSGTRYTLTMWFTRNESAMETLESLQQQWSWVLQPSSSNLLNDTDWAWWTHCSTLQSQSPPSQQPWETPEQALLLLQETMRHAQLEWNDELKCWCLPALMVKEATGESCPVDIRIRSMLQQTPWLLSLISYCWWKHDKALGILTRKGLTGLLSEWQVYLKGRFMGLQHASRRWIDLGMIANVTDYEMDIINNIGHPKPTTCE